MPVLHHVENGVILVQVGTKAERPSLRMLSWPKQNTSLLRVTCLVLMSSVGFRTPDVARLYNRGSDWW